MTLGTGIHLSVGTVTIDSRLMQAMRRIAYGRDDNGRPLAGSEAQRIMRDAMIACGLDWSCSG